MERLAAKIVTLLILAASLSYAVAVPAFGAEVLGVVLDAKRNPVGGATVALQDPRAAVVIMTTSSDRDGQYCIDHLNPGAYDLLLEAQGPEVQTALETLNTAARIRLGPEGLTVNWRISLSGGATAAIASGASPQTEDCR